MIGSRVLLDTNIVSAILKGEASVVKSLENCTAVYLPIIALGELYFGAEYSSKITKNISSLKRLSGKFKQLQIDEGTCQVYGKLKAHLRNLGTPIPENDIWIASIAIQHNLNLFTRDKHFVGLPKLKFRLL